MRHGYNNLSAASTDTEWMHGLFYKAINWIGGSKRETQNDFSWWRLEIRLLQQSYEVHNFSFSTKKYANNFSHWTEKTGQANLVCYNPCFYRKTSRKASGLLSLRPSDDRLFKMAFFSRLILQTREVGFFKVKAANTLKLTTIKQRTRLLCKFFSHKYA